jgi:hypothetical protein
VGGRSSWKRCERQKRLRRQRPTTDPRPRRCLWPVGSLRMPGNSEETRCPMTAKYP